MEEEESFFEKAKRALENLDETPFPYNGHDKKSIHLPELDEEDEDNQFELN